MGYALEFIEPTLPPLNLVISKNGAWEDKTKNGLLDDEESYLSTVKDDFSKLQVIKGVDFSSREVEVRFIDFYLGDKDNPVSYDLRGFGADDKLIIDFSFGQQDWYGGRAWMDSNGGTVSAAPSAVRTIVNGKYVVAENNVAAITNQTQKYQFVTVALGGTELKAGAGVNTGGSPFYLETRDRLLASLGTRTVSFEVVNPFSVSP